VCGQCESVLGVLGVRQAEAHEARRTVICTHCVGTEGYGICLCFGVIRKCVCVCVSRLSPDSAQTVGAVRRSEAARPRAVDGRVLYMYSLVSCCVYIKGDQCERTDFLFLYLSFSLTMTWCNDESSLTPYDCTPGKAKGWDDSRLKILHTSALLRNEGAQSDDRGWSLTTTFDGTDEGAPGRPALPTNAAELRKAQAARRRRLKDSYSLLAVARKLADSQT
jgi:hypothetical protein